MSKYGKVAIAAVQLITSGIEKHPPYAWDKAVKSIFPDSESSQRKGCPRGAFLGLCEEGLVKGIPCESYTRSKLNKQYAVDAVQLLRERPALADNPDQLWQQIPKDDAAKRENSQMDVVITLWKHRLIADSLLPEQARP